MDVIIWYYTTLPVLYRVDCEASYDTERDYTHRDQKTITINGRFFSFPFFSLWSALKCKSCKRKCERIRCINSKHHHLQPSSSSASFIVLPTKIHSYYIVALLSPALAFTCQLLVSCTIICDGGLLSIEEAQTYKKFVKYKSFWVYSESHRYFYSGKWWRINIGNRKIFFYSENWSVKIYSRKTMIIIKRCAMNMWW